MRPMRDYTEKMSNLMLRTPLEFWRQPLRYWRGERVEWFAEYESRYLERVYYRKRNPFGIYGTLGVFYLIAFFALHWVVPVAEPSWYPLSQVLRKPLGINWLALIGTLSLGASVIGFVAVRRKPESETRLREDRYYPPKEYWESAEVDSND
jgi:hypothetical protein